MTDGCHPGGGVRRHGQRLSSQSDKRFGVRGEWILKLQDLWEALLRHGEVGRYSGGSSLISPEALGSALAVPFPYNPLCLFRFV